MIPKVSLFLVNRLFRNHQTQKFRILKIPKRFQKRMKITFNRIMQQALRLQLKLLGIFWTLIKTIPEDDLATTLSEKLLGHLLKHIVKSVRSAWDLFIDEGMLRHIQRYTEEEARTVLQTDNWRASLHELDTFLAIVYARGAHKATKIKVHEL